MYKKYWKSEKQQYIYIYYVIRLKNDFISQKLIIVFLNVGRSVFKDIQ